MFVMRESLNPFMVRGIVVSQNDLAIRRHVVIAIMGFDDASTLNSDMFKYGQSRPIQKGYEALVIAGRRTRIDDVRMQKDF